LPSLYLHRRDDGCMTPAFAHWVRQALPDGSDVTVVEHAGHFLQLDEPERVADLVLSFIGPAD
jgi:pimeloyl-ACP methyl ester carboxylesterase